MGGFPSVPNPIYGIKDIAEDAVSALKSIGNILGAATSGIVEAVK